MSHPCDDNTTQVVKMGQDIKDFLTENGVKWTEVNDLKARRQSSSITHTLPPGVPRSCRPHGPDRTLFPPVWACAGGGLGS